MLKSRTRDIRADFPIFSQKFEGKELVYLDSAATTQKPKVVIDAITNYYCKSNAAVGRSSHFLADIATEKYENARKTVADFINAPANEIVFTKNATEGLNLAAFGWGSSNISQDDIILTTTAAHNSSLLPWKAIANNKNATIEYMPITQEGALKTGWETSITSKVKVIVVSHVSNVLGSVLPIAQICKKAKEVGAIVVVDGSQAVSHLDIDVQKLGCDFYVFSGHKMYGPTGIGVFWAKGQHLESMELMYYGGGTVKASTVARSDLREIPYRFEAGTPNVAGAAGLAAAIEYMNTKSAQTTQKAQHDMLSYAQEQLSTILELKMLGPKNASDRCSLISFYIEGVHSHDVAAILSSDGVAARAGLHCAMHLYENMGIPPAVRISFGIYNTKEDVDTLMQSLKKAVGILLK